jgi:hypothetical protein
MLARRLSDQTGYSTRVAVLTPYRAAALAPCWGAVTTLAGKLSLSMSESTTSGRLNAECSTPRTISSWARPMSMRAPWRAAIQLSLSDLPSSKASPSPVLRTKTFPLNSSTEMACGGTPAARTCQSQSASAPMLMVVPPGTFSKNHVAWAEEPLFKQMHAAKWSDEASVWFVAAGTMPTNQATPMPTNAMRTTPDHR